jgi:hypothetical protein
MKKSKLSDSQLFAMLNEAEAGVPVNDVCRKYGGSSPKVAVNFHSSP